MAHWRKVVYASISDDLGTRRVQFAASFPLGQYHVWRLCRFESSRIRHHFPTCASFTSSHLVSHISDQYLRQSVTNNGSLFADIFLVKEGAAIDPKDPSFNPVNIHFVRKCRGLRIISLPCHSELTIFTSTYTIHAQDQSSQGEEFVKRRSRGWN